MACDCCIHIALIGMRASNDVMEKKKTAAVLLSQRVAAYGLQTVEPVDEK